MPLSSLWNVFWRLRRRVNGTGFGPGCITWSDIDAFCRHSRRMLDPWEIELIEMLDDVYLNPKPDDGKD